MLQFSLFRAALWMTAALAVEATILPHWIPVRWIPQISFLILLYVALKHGVRAGLVLGALLGIEESLFTALPAGSVFWVYAALGGAAGAARSYIFLESPMAQWLAPIAFGLLTELAFFWMVPSDGDPLGWADFSGMIRASNLPITWILSGVIYAWCDRRLFTRNRR